MTLGLAFGLLYEYKYVRIPYWRNKNGGPIKQKYYIFKPKGPNKGWHDYCTGPAVDAYYPGGVSFKGPCARHDLCIEFKQAPHRSYCDTHFKRTLRVNCKNVMGKPSNLVQRTHLRGCLSTASVYYKAVARHTNKKSGAGKWGHTGMSWWPTYKYNVWAQSRVA